MIQTLHIAHSGGSILVGPAPAHPEQTALFEGRGATLHWDVLSSSELPSAEITDIVRAAEWLWEIYGSDTATAILTRGDGRLDVPIDSNPVRDTARRLAHLSWAEAWWPASVVAGVPSLDTGVLHAEQAAATGAVEHLLDDDTAVERALHAAADALTPLAAWSSHPELGTHATDLAALLTDLADDYGIVLSEPVSVAPSRGQFALAAGAGTTSDGIVAMRGASPVDWALVPPGTVDAAADATWAVVRRTGASLLDVSVPGAPSAPNGVRLAARFGPVELILDRTRTSGGFTGQAPVPASVLLLPAAQRVLTVYAPDFAAPDSIRPIDPDASARRAAIIAVAKARTTAQDATLTERLTAA